MSSKYFLEKSIEERKQETKRMKEKYPHRTLIFLEKSKNCNLPDIDKNKFLVPKDLSVGQMIHVIRKRMKINASQSIYLFTENNNLPVSSQSISSLYDTNANEDGFMYLTYNTEEVYG